MGRLLEIAEHEPGFSETEDGVRYEAVVFPILGSRQGCACWIWTMWLVHDQPIHKSLGLRKPHIRRKKGFLRKGGMQRIEGILKQRAMEICFTEEFRR